MHLDGNASVNQQPPAPCKQEPPTFDADRLRQLSDKAFVSYSADAFKQVTTKEADILVMPWGPRLDVIFDPKGAPGFAGGSVRIYGRTKNGDMELASTVIQSAGAPVRLTAEYGCDAYAIRAVLGSEPPATGAPRVESYVYARVYAPGR
jgi:hypothetical protein